MYNYTLDEGLYLMLLRILFLFVLIFFAVTLLFSNSHSPFLLEKQLNLYPFLPWLQYHPFLSPLAC